MLILLRALTILAAAIAGGAVLYVALAPLRRLLDRRWDRAPRAQAHVCSHCGRELIPGSYPPIFSACHRSIPDCPGNQR